MSFLNDENEFLVDLNKTPSREESLNNDGGDFPIVQGIFLLQKVFFRKNNSSFFLDKMEFSMQT